jgi:hypothetical protein
MSRRIPQSLTHFAGVLAPVSPVVLNRIILPRCSLLFLLLWPLVLSSNGCVLEELYANGYHVSPSGNDTHTGTLDAPFLTLGKAQSAMRSGNIKKTYLHSGLYSGSQLFLTAPDNGETWQYYPPDGFNSAILDSTGLIYTITISASKITINGIKIRNSISQGIIIEAGTGYPATIAEGNIIKNCEITGMTDPNYQGRLQGAIIAVGNTPSTQILHNYVHDVASMAIRGGQTNAATGPGNYNNTVIRGNAIINTATSDTDNGAIDLYDTVPSKVSTNIIIDSNYIRDYNGIKSGYAIYLDLGASNTTISNNIITGAHQTPNGAFAIQMDDSNNVTITNNIFDLSDTNLLLHYVNGDLRPAADAGNNNIIEHNLILNSVQSILSVTTLTSGTVPLNFYDNAYANFQARGPSYPPIGSPTFSGNYYANYYSLGSGPWLNTSGNNFKDTDAVRASSDPKISCWAYTIATDSPVLNSPVNFVPITASFGPPGFIIPHTGTPPSSPHAC